jgi:hypothetical protein
MLIIHFKHHICMKTQGETYKNFKNQCVQKFQPYFFLLYCIPKEDITREK